MGSRGWRWGVEGGEGMVVEGGMGGEGKRGSRGEREGWGGGKRGR